MDNTERTIFFIINKRQEKVKVKQTMKRYK